MWQAGAQIIPSTLRYDATQASLGSVVPPSYYYPHTHPISVLDRCNNILAIFNEDKPRIICAIKMKNIYIARTVRCWKSEPPYRCRGLSLHLLHHRSRWLLCAFAKSSLADSRTTLTAPSAQCPGRLSMESLGNSSSKTHYIHQQQHHLRSGPKRLQLVGMKASSPFSLPYHPHSQQALVPVY